MYKIIRTNIEGKQPIMTWYESQENGKYKKLGEKVMKNPPKQRRTIQYISSLRTFKGLIK